MSARALRPALAALLALPCAVAVGCFDRASRWDTGASPVTPACEPGVQRCAGGALEVCSAASGAAAWVVEDDCPAAGLVCVPGVFACKVCLPSSQSCEGQEVYACDATGEQKTLTDTCDPSVGEACRAGGCRSLCATAAVERSNVGCEYWAVDLDNAMIDFTSNAAGQQFAVVISNPQPDVPAHVVIEQDDGEPGGPHAELVVAEAIIAPRTLRVFALGPREVDGSAPGTFDTGTHTALTRAAYRVRSSFPVVAYQFNPLENVAVFSNDASLLKPRESFPAPQGALETAYVAVGWPQTIAATDDPNTNFNPADPIHLRAFLTIVATQDDTLVEVDPTAVVVGGGPIPETGPGQTLSVTLQAFEVLNLETGDFNADFTGSVVRATGPIAVWSGGEASDAPHFETLASRRCCADHLEDQLDPVRTAGTRFVLAHTPNRSATVKAAGGDIEAVSEPDFVRVVCAHPDGATLTTTLPAPYDQLALAGFGDFVEIEAHRDFELTATRPVHVGQISASQDATGVRRGLPGGDPSLVIVPPIEQYRPDYVFLTPDKYAFDHVTFVVPAGAEVVFDELPLDALGCEVAPADGLTAEERGAPEPERWVYRCQLGFATVDPTKDVDNVFPGQQADGVHVVSASQAIGLFVTGFDAYVSYGYAAGTELREIAAPL